MIDIDKLNFAKGDGRVTVVAQDAVTGMVLMVALADREAMERTIATGEMHYTSRTRGLWHKGATSGNTQKVISLDADCDGDSVLARVRPAGPACHDGTVSCFGRPQSDAVSSLALTIESRAADESRDRSYTRKLLDDRNLMLKKIGEESAELVVACADKDRERAAEEAADLIYHVMVALQSTGVTWDQVQEVLNARSVSRSIGS
jgi:phosphoribosyl-ATP pyrophosphohydrolase/phosphoribosyl-AMP cyclohydrolase